MRTKTNPTVTEKSDGHTVETHPSYGMVALNRWTSSGGRQFFGSAVTPHAGVSLVITRGERVRSLNQYWYHGHAELISVDLTEAQFAQLVTSMNIGSGVPCTISHLNRKAMEGIPDGMVPECPEVSPRKLVEQEFDKDMKELAVDVAKLVAKAKQLEEKPTINKTDRKEFSNIAHAIECYINSHLPFMQSQFNEAMDDIVTHAKADVDSFTSQLLRQAGADAIKDKLAQTEIKLLPGE